MIFWKSQSDQDSPNHSVLYIVYMYCICGFFCMPLTPLPAHELNEVFKVFRAFMLFIKLGGFFFRQCSLLLSQYFHALWLHLKTSHVQVWESGGIQIGVNTIKGIDWKIKPKQHVIRDILKLGACNYIRIHSGTSYWHRARNNGRPTNNVRPKRAVVQSNFCTTGHFDQHKV